MTTILVKNDTKYLTTELLSISSDESSSLGPRADSNIAYIMGKQNNFVVVRGASVSHDAVTGTQVIESDDETPAILISEYSDGSKTLYVREDVEEVENYIGLVNEHIVFDLELYEETKKEWSEDYFYDYANAELYKRSDDESEDKLDNMSDHEAFELYNKALKDAGIEIEFKGLSASIDIDKIAPYFMKNVDDYEDQANSLR